MQRLGKVILEPHPVHADDIRESFRLAFESVRHLTTLSAGSLVLIATFLNNIFPEDLNRGDQVLVSASFLSFVVSLVFSTFSMWRISGLIRSRREYEKKKRKIRWKLLLPSFAYILGLSFFGTAVLSFTFGMNADQRRLLYACLALFVVAVGGWCALRVRQGRRRDHEVDYQIVYPSKTDIGELEALERGLFVLSPISKEGNYKPRRWMRSWRRS